MTTIKGMVKENSKGSMIIARDYGYQVFINNADDIFSAVNEKAYGYAKCNVIIKMTAIKADTGKVFTEVRYKRNADVIIESPCRNLELYIPVRGFSVQGKKENTYTIDSEMIKIKVTNYNANNTEMMRLYGNIFGKESVADILAQVED